MNIFVGNLAQDVTSEDLQQLFGAFGEVSSANVIRDRYTGNSRGFGFVEMPSGEAARAAISGLNGRELKGRAINVNEAKPREGGGGPGRRPGGQGRRRY
ncbi:MAG TPA: RNA-binding protein [Deltaproteobacteria bacterium]|nr:RNA-binding protein [Deltaproteobacteria bacterium]